MPFPGWIGQALRWLTAALAVVFFGFASFAAIVMPYRFWDSLAFGAWSRSIAETGNLWSGQPALFLQRPLFYVEQGLVWKVLGQEMWIGRLLSLSFGAILTAAIWSLARQLTADRDLRVLLPQELERRLTDDFERAGVGRELELDAGRAQIDLDDVERNGARRGLRAIDVRHAQKRRGHVRPRRV